MKLQPLHLVTSLLSPQYKPCELELPLTLLLSPLFYINYLF